MKQLLLDETYLPMLLSECSQLNLHLIAGQEGVHTVRKEGRVPTATTTHAHHRPATMLT